MRSQSVMLNGSQAPGRPLLDLFLQLVAIASAAAPVLLVFYLLARDGEGPSAIGVDCSQPLARPAARRRARRGDRRQPGSAST